MRWIMRALAALMVLTLVPAPVVAQDDLPRLLEDATGDVSGDGAGAVLPPGDVGPLIDLVALAVEETRTDFIFHVTVDDIPDDPGPTEIQSSIVTAFEHNGQGFHLTVFRSNVGDLRHGAGLYRMDGGSSFGSYQGAMDLRVDASSDTYSVTVPRDLLRDGEGAKPAPGRVLDEFWVQSQGNSIGGICLPECTTAVAWTDAMPDDGPAKDAYEVAIGIRQEGDARLTSQEPFRASNGEATTFVFKVDAQNLADEAQRFEFKIDGTPESWDVRLPSRTVYIEAEESVEIPVLVRTAFAHSHGSSEAFILELHGLQDEDSIGRIELGVYYPEIPQPAGHHDTLWLHSYDQSDDPLFLALGTAIKGLGVHGWLEQEFMNTLEVDDRADDVPSEAEYCQAELTFPGLPVNHYCWNYPLDPGLVMGLDFDLERQGTLDVTISTEVPLLEATLTGELLYLHPVDDPDDPFAYFSRESTVLAHINSTQSHDVDALSSQAFQAVVTPTEEADLVPYEAGAALSLQLDLASTRPDNFFIGPKAPPSMEGGGRLQLPLREYADPVEEAYSFGGDLSLRAVGSQEALVNPGNTVLFEAMLRNDGDEKRTVALELVGSHLDWSQLLSKPEVTLAPGATHQLAIAVSANETATDGEHADLVLTAVDVDDPSVRTLLRLVALVDSTVDHPDMSEEAGKLQAKQDKSSPAPMVWLALAAALFMARRR